jgi:type III secretion protein R
MNASGIAWLLVITVAPMLLLTLTSFMKISVVLSSVRNALGAQDMPSSLVITAMAFVLTLFVMAPVGLKVATAMNASTDDNSAVTQAPGSPSAATPTWSDVIPAEYRGTANRLDRALQPLREFLKAHTGADEVATFRNLASAGDTASVAARRDDLWILAPAFVTSELKAAFSIAVLLLLPFMLIDVLVAIGITAIGLPSLSPQTVALPLKLLLFVAVDGWRLIIEGLLRGYV